MTIDIELVGADDLIRMLARGGKEILPAMGRALHEEAQDIFSKSQSLVPHDEGTLMGSGQLHAPNYSGAEVIVEITYGGNARDYAWYQHETEGLRHDPGRQDHYLSDPFDAALAGMQDRLTDRIQAIVMGLY